jgi:hypothetical protein
MIVSGWSELLIAVARLGTIGRDVPDIAALDGAGSEGVAWGGRLSKEVRQRGFLADQRAG